MHLATSPEPHLIAKTTHRRHYVGGVLLKGVASKPYERYSMRWANRGMQNIGERDSVTAFLQRVSKTIAML
jgi:hypothetical protein